MRSAFTIIEVIVTFVILSILIFFAIYSFRYSIVNVKKASFYLPKTTIVYSTMDNIISGIYYYAVETKKNEFVDFFYGVTKNFTFVTSSAFFSNQTSLAKISFENNKLKYTEEPLFSKNINYEKPVFSADAKTIVLSKAIHSSKISYILQNGKEVQNVTNEIPKGIVIKFLKNKHKYHYIFSISSNYKYNKVRQQNEKYPTY